MHVMPRGVAAVFLDRDDTLNVNSELPAAAFPGTAGDLYLPEYVELVPGAAEACGALRAAGYVLIIVTNQAGVARGHCTMADVDATNDRVRELLAAACGGEDPIAAAYTAPHHPDAAVASLRAAHPWRKPGPGMVLEASRDFAIDLAASWLIGDKERDREAGVNAGIPRERCLRVGRDEGCGFADLAEAAGHVLRWSAGAGTGVKPGGGVVAVAASSASLRAAQGEPLADHRVRRTVESVAHAIAERTGIRLLSIACEPARVTVTLATHRLAAIGFLAELRRLTNRWHAARWGTLLWPAVESDGDGAEPGEDDPLGPSWDAYGDDAS